MFPLLMPTGFNPNAQPALEETLRRRALLAAIPGAPAGPGTGGSPPVAPTSASAPKPGGLAGLFGDLDASPENLALIAGGLSALGGAPLDQAINTGLGAYGAVDGIIAKKRQREAINKATAGMTPEQQALARAFPEIYAQRKLESDFREPAKQKMTELGRLMAERDALAPNDPRRTAYNNRIRKLGKSLESYGVSTVVAPDGTVTTTYGRGAGGSGGVRSSTGRPAMAQPGETATTAAGVPVETGRGKKYAEYLSKAEVATLNALREEARGASDLRVSIDNMKAILPHVGHTGRGAGTLGALDKTGEAIDDFLKYADIMGEDEEALGSVIPGSTGARESFNQMSNEMVVDATSKLKGAISEKEIELLKTLPPGMLKTKEGNMTIIRLLEEGARRKEMKVEFYEKYAGTNQSLQGADRAWSDYIENNRLLDFDPQGNIIVQPQGDMLPYITGANRREERLPLPSGASNDIRAIWSQMSREDQQLYIDSLRN